ncbi:hypothetical protein J3A83DRAFT_4098514 [Scleroderma citrinum]
MDPLIDIPAKFCLGVAATTYILSLLTGNVSHIDRLWTVLPTIYTAYFALVPLWPPAATGYVEFEIIQQSTASFSSRALLMLALVLLLSRLTYNTWRRGLYNLNDEDYRWAIVRRNIPPWLFQVLNLTFIAIAQNILLLLLAIPVKMAVTQPHTTLSTSDYILGALGFLTILLEFIADNQQYSYQTFKRSGQLNRNEWFGARIPWTKRDAERGFVTRGLWAWSRHPNCLCEQAFWIIINAFPLLSPDAPKLFASGVTITSLASLAPCLLLCLLFFSSTRLTESISLSKYPVAYAAYQRRVGMFVPFFTPVWGVLLKLQGKKAEVDELVYGQGRAKKTE